MKDWIDFVLLKLGMKLVMRRYNFIHFDNTQDYVYSVAFSTSKFHFYQFCRSFINDYEEEETERIEEEILNAESRSTHA